MIDPCKITNFKRTPNELFEFAVFCVCVAGKNADQTARKVHALVNDEDFRTYCIIQWDIGGRIVPNSELERKCIANLRSRLEYHKIGQYARIAPAIFRLNQLHAKLGLIKFDDLIAIKGIGPKTASFFLLHSRPDATVPCIDTHMLKFMASKDINMKIESSVARYKLNAQEVVFWMNHDYPNLSLAEADLEIWKKFSGRA